MSVSGVLEFTAVKMARCKNEIMPVQSKVCIKFYSREHFIDLCLSAKESYLWEIWRKNSTGCWTVDIREAKLVHNSLTNKAA
jgi:hypothetical protein